ncbi:copper chaperone PCu(A)C [Asanoa sp. WMMD1127]|uniref:copper chaperone PCu(A)C n=1 Tax=Asanoa sp. WMMD1127 TaxID=3016107 RepID=UPI002416251D|nr:copper chaperone PCu(A)C [Asanoa sp. WMMD1127]MDG4827466.1 copper chaperone PCu(A)C [Asanoa sp. WMMD1127]
MSISTTARGLALAATAAFALLAGACGSAAEPASTSTPPPPSASVPADPIAVRDMWVKTADKGMTAAFGTLLNTGGSDIRIVKATSTASPMMELHEVAEVDGKMEMRPKEGGFEIPAGGSHELKPGGDHLMMMDVKAPVKAGDEVTFTLTLDSGTTFEFTAVAKDFAGGNESYNPGASASPMTMG